MTASFLRSIEIAYADFARNYTLAAKELNPYADCEILELGNSVAVYSGAFSPIHGVFAAGIDGPLTAEDKQEIDSFFHKVEREAWWHLSEASDPSLRPTFHDLKPIQTSVAVVELKNWNPESSATDVVLTVPKDHQDWLLAHTRSRKGNFLATEPDLYSATILHMKNARLYMHPSQRDAAFIFFSQGGAIIFNRPGQLAETLHALVKEAKEYGATWLALFSDETPPPYFEKIPHWTFTHETMRRNA